MAPILAVITFAVIFPIKIMTRNIDEFLIRKMTLFFFLRFSSSISACVSEKIEDSEMEKTDDIMRNRENSRKKSIRCIIYKCLNVKFSGRQGSPFFKKITREGPLAFVMRPISLILIPMLSDNLIMAFSLPGSADHKSS